VTASAPTIYFVRHGETDWNAEGRLQGQRDIPINATGRGQAAAAGLRLRHLVPDADGLDYVASPLGRTRETMERLRQAIGLAPDCYRLDARLKELTFGGWEGLTWREVRAREPKAVAARQRDKWRFVPPGGESYAMLAGRVAPIMAEIRHDTVVVSHGGVARALLVLLCGLCLQRAANMPICQGRILVIQGDRFRWA
jgi:broad specificity phosphatase PhoE